MNYVWELLSAKTDAEVYPDSARPELVELVEGSPRRALDIGCHRGAVGAALKARFPGLYYVGIETNPETAKAAKERLDAVICEDFLALDTERHPAFAEPFDMVVLADILEHVYDPWKTLRKLATRLSSSGRVYASIPNVRNAWLIEQLIQGNWTYEPAGLLDVTHIRFFTLRECLKMFEQTGFRVQKVASVRDQRVNIRGDFTGPITLTNPHYTLTQVDRQMAAELATMQFLFVLSRAGAIVRGAPTAS